MGVMDRLRPGKRLYPRDLRFFWAALEENGFGGNARRAQGKPAAGLCRLVAERVRRLLEQPAPPATNGRGSAR